ncbi:MAG: hypothetical protein ABGY71_11845 [bacterium]|nr:hypothetical protein [Planctomycetota bacterium]HIL51507.1 hypothetical protein [Planctomycetota bacterium]
MLHESSLAVALLLACPHLLQAQAGTDGCTTPDTIAGEGSFAVDSSAATTGSEGQLDPGCLWFGSTTVENDVWFDWTASLDGVATVSTCGSVLDTKIAAWPGAGCPAAGNALACNDDACGLQSSISFSVVSGTVYALQVGSFPGAPGGLAQMDISIVATPVHDDCNSPMLLNGSGSFAFNNSGATAGAQGQAEALCLSFGSTSIDRDLWYRWIATVTGTAVIRTCGSSVDTKLAAYPNVLCPQDGAAITCNDDGCGLQSTLLLPATSGTAYMLQVGSFPGAAGGTGLLQIDVQPPLVADDCATPVAIAGQGSFAFNNLLASTGLEGQNESLCLGFGASGIDRDVWFDWTADATGEACVSTCGILLDTKLAVYPAGGCPAAGSAIQCNDDAAICGGLQAAVKFAAFAGSSYLFQLGNFPGAAGGSGSFDVSIATGPGSPFCSCTLAASPCTNPGLDGHGCANSAAPGGSVLSATGNPVVGTDTVVLSASGLPSGEPCLFFQGMNRVNGGAGNTFGDGLRCVGGDIRRLGVSFARGTGVADTSALMQPISVRGGVQLGDLRHYQVWYRDSTSSPCGIFFNLSNGYSIQW